MTLFVLVAAALALLAAGVVLFGPRRQAMSQAASQSRTSAEVLRQQLAEIELDRARGLLDEREFAQLRDDLQRRLLDDVAPQAPAAPRVAQSRRALALSAAALPLAAALLYLHFGQPQLLREAGAPASAATDAAAAGNGDPMLARLEAHVAAEPNDARAWVMLGRARMQADQFEPAAAAYRRALDASPKVARDPLVWCEYADALGMAQGGRLAGRPREMIDRALALDAAHPRALEMAGSAAYEAGEFRAAAAYWQRLLPLLPQGSAEQAQLGAAIARAEQRARFALPSS
jgi:cytochrome c-type biogenesis protein CcmH